MDPNGPPPFGLSYEEHDTRNWEATNPGVAYVPGTDFAWIGDGFWNYNNVINTDYTPYAPGDNVLITDPDQVFSFGYGKGLDFDGGTDHEADVSVESFRYANFHDAYTGPYKTTTTYKTVALPSTTRDRETRTVERGYETTEDLHLDRARRRERVLESYREFPMPIAEPGQSPEVPTHSEAPPAPGTVERKVKATGGFAAIAFGAVTEFSDLVNAIHDALPAMYKEGWYKLHMSQKKWDSIPESVKEKGYEFYSSDGKTVTFYRKRWEASLLQKSADIYEHYDKIDINNAVFNIAMNQMQDAAIGKLGAAAQKVAKPWLDLYKRPVGFGFGPAM